MSPRRTQGATALQTFLRNVAVLEFPDEAAVHYAKIRADLKTREQTIGANDLVIAAHARSLGLRLVTMNIAEFNRVKQATPNRSATTCAQYLQGLNRYDTIQTPLSKRPVVAPRWRP